MVLGDHRAAGLASEDDRGLVLRLTSGETSILFPGDIGVERELELVNKEVQLYSTILLSPHHGSATSNSPEFLAAVSPDWLIISNGDSQSRLFPAQKILDAAEKMGIPILSTAEDGTIVIKIDGGGEGYRLALSDVQERYWKKG